MSTIRYKNFLGERHFGVEIEINEKVDRSTLGTLIKKVDSKRECRVTGWQQTGDVPGGVGSACWHVKTDSTCADIPGNHGYEVASFKGKGVEDIRTIGRVAHNLERGNVSVNHKCGFHVHVDIGDFTRDEAGVLLAHWLKVEHFIAQAVPAHRRTNKYCKLMRQKHNIDYKKNYRSRDLYAMMEPTDLNPHHNTEKRVCLNFVGYAIGLRDKSFGRKTVELRIPEGTVSRFDIENWTRFFVHFVEETKPKGMIDLEPSKTLDEAMEIFGLEDPNSFLILRKDLYDTKVWFLKRILSFSDSTEIVRSAVKKLNMMMACDDKLATRYKIEDDTVNPFLPSRNVA